MLSCRCGIVINTGYGGCDMTDSQMTARRTAGCSNGQLRQHKVRKAKLRRGKGVLDGHTLLEDLHDTPQEAQRRQEALIFRAIFILAAGVILLYLVIMRYGRRGSSWSKGS